MNKRKYITSSSSFWNRQARIEEEEEKEEEDEIGVCPFSYARLCGTAMASVMGFLFVCILLLEASVSGATTIIYQTGFEVSEGYRTNADLVGQQKWVGAGVGGNGIVTGFFPTNGQQAYIGFSPPPAAPNFSLYVYRLLNQTLPSIQFSVTMAVIDSSTTNRDDFYWSVFNQQGQQLFTLDFNNDDLNVYYFLDNTNGPTRSGLTFTNDGIYVLNVSMNFASNRWTASLSGAVIASNQPISTVGAPLNLGDIDAAWAVANPNAPGDNFMLFDDYQVSANVPQPQLRILGTLNGSPTLRITGLENNRFALEASTNLLKWVALRTNTVAGGSFDFVDDTAAGVSRRFYRARWVP